MAAQFLAAGKVLNAAFDIPPILGMIIGAGIILFYTVIITNLIPLFKGTHIDLVFGFFFSIIAIIAVSLKTKPAGLEQFPSR